MVISVVINDRKPPSSLQYELMLMAVCLKLCCTALCINRLSMISRTQTLLKEKFGFSHIKPYNKDIHNLIQCSTALLWWTVQSRELEFLADVTTSWKQWRWRGISNAPTVRWKRRVIECLVVSSHVPTLKHKVEQQLLTQKWLISAASRNKQTVVSGSLAAV